MSVKLLQTGIRYFSISSTECVRLHNPYPKRPPGVFTFYYRVGLTSQVAATQWDQMSKAEKEPYEDLYREKLKQYQTKEHLKNREEFEEIMAAVSRLVVDKPKQYNCVTTIFHAQLSKDSAQEVSSQTIKAMKMWKLMSEEEKEVYQAKYDKTKEDLEGWKQKVRADGRISEMKALTSKLKTRLKALETDKPKLTPVFNLYFQHNVKIFQEPLQEKIKIIVKKWNSLTEEERQPFVDVYRKSSEDLVAWKEKVTLDGKMMIIVKIRRIITQLRC
jgi:hypothetical protein